MREKVIIYGGAFNPPTRAHQLITQKAADYAEEIHADLWLMPSGERTDKDIRVPVSKRLSYAHGLLASLCTEVTTQVYDYELKSTELTQTCKTYDHLKRQFPGTEFSWIFGSDSIATMPKWEKGPELIEEMSLLVVQRAGYEIELTETMTDLTENMTSIELEQLSISSTQVRGYIAIGGAIDHLVPSTVLPIA